MSEAKLKEKMQDAETPIWDGLYDRDGNGPYIVGGRCEACGGMALGVRAFCPHCLASGRMSSAPIGRRGTLYTATVIHQAPPGFTTPLRVGYVDVEGGVRVFAHIDNGPGAPAIGDEVALTIQALQTRPDGGILQGPFYVGARKATRHG